ncbi:MAG TPA: PAS domain S-box protein [Sphingomicrobium sp.]|jgi:two-component system sensor kinase FixL|nr:PAS domain S-box protein [Sphingomicrobium sp.]
MDQPATERPLEAEAHLRSILATVPDAMVVIDEAGLILSFSAAAEKMFGYAEGEVVGENVKILMPNPDRDRHDQYLVNYLTTGIRKIIGVGRVTTALHRDGNTFPIELSVGEAWSEGHRIFTGFIRDLTERQQTLLRLQDLQSELAHVGRVSEMGTLASSLAHELNQPLTAVASYCESARDLLQTKADDETLEMVSEAMEEAAKQAIRAGQIVRRLRDFMSYGETERQVESMQRLINEANALALVGSREHQIDMQLSLDARADRVFVDRIQVQQVLVNLIRNAIDAMIDAPVRHLSIRTQRQDGLTRVTVEDTGSGINETIAEQLFQPFVTSKQNGMGIGLSICRTIVQAHGGRIWFEPGRGGGTAFHFTLPSGETKT